MSDCYCDGTQHRHRFDYCPRLPVHDPNTAIERHRERQREENKPKSRLCWCGAAKGHDWSDRGPISYRDALRKGTHS